MIVDSHCHLNRLELDLDTALTAARQVGVEHFLTVAVELSDVEELKRISAAHPDISYSVGWHPTSVEAGNKLPWLIEEGRAEKCCAIGETGLDFYHIEDEAQRLAQKDLFAQHILAAKQVSKPLIIHTRAAIDATIDVMVQEHADEIGGVMHCFTEDWASAKRCMDHNFMISLSGIVTFKNATLVHEVAKKIPLSSLLIETDCPYLAPVPHRGQANQPAWVKWVALKIAELKGISYEELAAATTANFYRLFNISKD